MILNLRDVAKKLINTPTDSNTSRMVWIVSNSMRFSIAKTWQCLRTKQNWVAWHNLIWLSLNVLKFSLIVWLATFDRLNTLSRLKFWGINISSIVCCLCENEDQSRDHLFFAWLSPASMARGACYFIG